MFAGKEIYKELSEKIAESSFGDAKKVNEIAEIIEKNQEEINQLSEQVKELEPWKSFSISADLKNINYIKILLGTIENKYKKEQVESVLNKEKIEYSITILNKDKNKKYPTLFALILWCSSTFCF